MVAARPAETITVEQTPLDRGTLSYDISLNRPETLNAINWSMVKAIHSALDIGASGLHITNQAQIYRLRLEAQSRVTSAHLSLLGIHSVARREPGPRRVG